MPALPIIAAALVLTGGLVATPDLGVCETTSAHAHPARPVPHEELPPWSSCLSHPSSAICGNCCAYWQDDCQEDCDEDDSECWMDCVWEHSDCVDACFGL